MVVPFENGSDNPAQDIFARGISDEVIGALIRFKNILVFGSGTSFQFRTEPSLRNAVPDAHIDYVLKGSINWVGSQFQVNAVLCGRRTISTSGPTASARSSTPAP